MSETFGLTQINSEKKQQAPQEEEELWEPDFVEDQQSIVVENKKQKEIVEQDWQKQERLWKIIQSKISFIPKDKFTHYENYPIRPGFYFFKALVNCKRPPKNVRVRVPVMLVPHEKNGPTMFYSDDQGFLHRVRDVSSKEYDDRLRFNHKRLTHRIQYLCEERDPYRPFNEKILMGELYHYIKKNLILKFHAVENDWETGKKILDYHNHQDRNYNFDSGNVEQQFLFTSTMKAQMMRVCYFTKHSTELKQSYGYQLVNSNHFFDPKKKIINLTKKYCTMSDEQDSFTITQIKGASLKEYERQSAAMVQYLEQNYPVKIENIVFDFIQDFFGQIYLVGCRYIKLNLATSMKDYLRDKAESYEEEEQQLDQLTCSVYCKLCGIIFKKDDASKTLTYKLLFEFQQHLKKRNIHLKNISITLNTTRQCRVCNLCYMLVVQEHELIEIEQKLAVTQQIPIFDPVYRVPIHDKIPKNRPALLEPDLKQWRIMFYVTDIQDIFNNYEGDPDNLYLQFKLFNFKTSWKLTSDSSQNKNKSRFKSFAELTDIRSTQQSFGKRSNGYNDEEIISNIGIQTQFEEDEHKQHSNKRDIELKCLRIYYFFSTSNDIQEFLQNSEIVIRITEGNKWNDLVAEGKSQTMQYFQNKQEEGQRHSCRVMLFFDNAKYCTLYLNSGLVCDKGSYDTSSMNLYKFNGVYFPDDSFYNSNPLPDVWMELFDVGYIYRKEEIMMNKDTYQPSCSSYELNQMLEVQEEKSKKQFKTVKSRFRDTRSISYTYNQKTGTVASQFTEKRALVTNNFFNRSNTSMMTNPLYKNNKTGSREDLSFQEKNLPQLLNSQPIINEDQENNNTSNNNFPQQKSLQEQKKRRIQSAKIRSYTQNTTNFSGGNKNSYTVASLLGNSLTKYTHNHNDSTQSNINNTQIHKTASYMDSTKDTRRIIMGNTTMMDNKELGKISETDSLVLQNKSKGKLRQIKEEQEQMDIYIKQWINKYSSASINENLKAKLANRPPKSSNSQKSNVQWKHGVKP